MSSHQNFVTESFYHHLHQYLGYCLHLFHQHHEEDLLIPIAVRAFLRHCLSWPAWPAGLIGWVLGTRKNVQLAFMLTNFTVAYVISVSFRILGSCTKILPLTCLWSATKYSRLNKRNNVNHFWQKTITMPVTRWSLKSFLFTSLKVIGLQSSVSELGFIWKSASKLIINAGEPIKLLQQLTNPYMTCLLKFNVFISIRASLLLWYSF